MTDIKIATWNVNSIKVRLEQILNWLKEHNPDILALQETKSLDENFPMDAIHAAGYEVTFSGQKTYNGVAILSKSKAKDVLSGVPLLDDPQRRILIASIDDIRVINLYIPNGQEVGSEKYAYKLDWLKKVTSHIETELKQHDKVVVLGDFNIAPKDEDVHDPDRWQDKVLCSGPERKAFFDMLALGLEDSFRNFPQAEKLYSWWDYRMLGFRRNHGLRIDHILISKALSNHAKSCIIDKEPRKLERPSDHAPVMLTLSL